MSVLKFKRFTRPQVLQRIGRPLLIRFLEKFQAELTSLNLRLPGRELSEPEWFGSLARILASPETLPDALAEALYAIDEMASPDGQAQLERAVEQAGLPVDFAPASSREDIALQVWLAAPELLARVHNQQRLRRLTAFEYFGTPLPAGQSPPFRTPEPAILNALSSAIDPWFTRHQRGHNTSRIELYQLPDRGPEAEPVPEFWFLIRHGDTYARAPAVEGQQTEIIHFRPQRDDVVVYSSERDEIRINSRTRGERDLYVRTFGACLRGSEDYFSLRNTYTLEPLRSEGSEALHTQDIPGIEKATLRSLEVALEEEQNHVLKREAADLFQCPSGLGTGEPIPRRGRLCCAAFDLHFAGCSKPRPVQVRPPNILKLGRHCDIRLVDSWLSRRGFRLKTQSPQVVLE